MAAGTNLKTMFACFGGQNPHRLTRPHHIDSIDRLSKATRKQQVRDNAAGVFGIRLTDTALLIQAKPYFVVFRLSRRRLSIPLCWSYLRILREPPTH